jgi:hypothetical protein
MGKPEAARQVESSSSKSWGAFVDPEGAVFGFLTGTH